MPFFSDIFAEKDLTDCLIEKCENTFIIIVVSKILNVTVTCIQIVSTIYNVKIYLNDCLIEMLLI